MRAHGLVLIEAPRIAGDEWVAHVQQAADATLFPRRRLATPLRRWLS
jgi:hypothetical protein